jgi:hypothetical protein
MKDPVNIRDLHPTQATLGLHFVAANIARFGSMDQAALGAVINETSIPVVRGPGKTYWMIDRHHFCRAVSEIGIKRVRISIKIKANHLDPAEFAQFMHKSALVHPYGSNGDEISFADLPATIGQLNDDPYRTLAGLVREAGGFKKEKRPFAEFLWADFYRHRIDADLLSSDLPTAVETAFQLSKSKAARHLPGWN